MTAIPRAVDLPIGSVVADTEHAYFRADDDRHHPWRVTNGGRYAHFHIDEALDAGATVLRVGDGTEEG